MLVVLLSFVRMPNAAVISILNIKQSKADTGTGIPKKVLPSIMPRLRSGTFGWEAAPALCTIW